MRPFFAAVVAAAALFAAARALAVSPCWSLFIPAALLAWPIAFGSAGYALFARRAVLSGAFRDESRIRRWLWGGRFMKLAHALAAFFWAVLTVGLAALLDATQWIVLAADALLVALVLGPVRRRVEREVRAEHAEVVAHRWPLTLGNIVLLAAAFFALDFFFVGAPDTRGLTWRGVFDQGWEQGMKLAACPAAGMFLGFLAAVERLTWHAGEVLIPSMPQRGWRVVAWAALLLQAGVLAYGFTRLLLGTAALAEHLARPPREKLGFAGPFWFAAALLAAAYLYMVWALQGADVDSLRERARRTTVWANPCRPDVAAMQALRAGTREEVAAARTAARAEAAVRIEQRLDAVFGEAEAGVDRYLDWYFTVLAEYQRIGALALGEVDTMMVQALERHLFGEGMLAERLEQASVEVARESQARMASTAAHLGLNVQMRVRESPCGLGELDLDPLVDTRRDLARVMTAAGGGALVAGVAVRSLARTAVSTAASRAASRSTLRVAGGLLGRQATKRGGSIVVGLAAAAGCAPGGPLAIVCGLGAGLITWLALDKALVTIDEALFRDAMKKEILDTLGEQRRQLSESLRAQHFAIIDGMAASLDATLDKMFIPARDL